jgi:ZIP family zinc transporter
MDGLAIGLGFQVSIGVGLIAALAVLAHDLMDGINTVVLSLAGFRSRLVAAAWLLLDAAAPAAGIWLSHQVRVSAVELAVGLALFAGGFLYIGTVELLPRAHAGGARSSAVVASAAGLGLIWLVVRLAG